MSDPNMHVYGASVPRESKHGQDLVNYRYHSWSTYCTRNIELSGKPRNKKRYVSHPPLFPTIPLHNVVIDNLHIFLRVSDVLINLLLVDLKRADAIERLNKFNKFDSEKYKHLDAYQKFVSSLTVPGYKFWIGPNSKQLKIQSLTAPE